MNSPGHRLALRADMTGCLPSQFDLSDAGYDGGAGSRREARDQVMGCVVHQVSFPKLTHQLLQRSETCYAQILIQASSPMATPLLLQLSVLINGSGDFGGDGVRFH